MGRFDTAMSVTEITRQWDKGSRTQRTNILTNFLRRHRGSTAAEIERDLGHGALLFFTRITAWLRLTYKLGVVLSLQLSALSLFLQGQRYLTQFMEVGGIQTLTDLICITPVVDDKINATLLLIHIANSGRVYREMICDGAGMECLVKATLRETHEKALELTGSLFLALGQGNPRKAAVVHSGLLFTMLHGDDPGALCAATTLRSLQLAKQSYGGPGGTMVGAEMSAEHGEGASYDALLDAVFHLLRSDSVKLRFEGMELLTIAAQNSSLLGSVVRRCIETLEKTDVSFDVVEATARPERRQKASCGRIICNVIQSPMTAENAEQVLTYVNRYSAHLTLGKYMKQCDGVDVPGTMECCVSLRRIAQGAFVSAAGTSINAVVTQNVTMWLRGLLGEELMDDFMRPPAISDEMAAKVCAVIAQSITGAQPAEEAAGRRQPDPINSDDEM
jgi:hypothetical protein